MVHIFYIDPSLDKEVIIGCFLASTHSDEETFMAGNILEKKRLLKKNNQHSNVVK